MSKALRQVLAEMQTAEREADRVMSDLLTRNKTLRAFVRKVADYSNDSWLAIEADALAPECAKCDPAGSGQEGA